MSLAIQPTGASFNDPSLPILGHDRMLNGGSLALIDFANVSLYPAQNNTFLGVLNGVRNKGANVMAWPASGSVTFSGGGMQFTAISGAPGLRVGTSAASGVEPAYDLTDLAVDSELLLIVWRKRTAAASSSSEIAFQITSGGAVSGLGSQQLMIAENVNGVACYYAGKTTITHGPPAVGSIEQLAWRIKPSGVNAVAVDAFRNGVKIGVFSLPYQALVSFTTTGGLAIGLGGLNVTGFIAPNNQCIYRVMLESLTLSTRDPERQVARDYALNNGRFS